MNRIGLLLLSTVLATPSVSTSEPGTPLDALVTELQSADASKRRKAAAAIKEIVPAKRSSVARLLPLLKHEDPVLRAEAVQLVGEVVAASGGGVGDRGKRRGRRSRLVSKQSEIGVELALKWLAAHQDTRASGLGSADGRWDCDGFAKHDPAGKEDGAGSPRYDVGVTGLALLAFMGAGYCDRGSHAHVSNVQEGLGFLLKAQGADGCIGPKDFARMPSNHAVATIALCEAWIHTWDARYRRAAQRAVRFLVTLRHPQLGWGYASGWADANTATTGWALYALRLGDLGGLDVDLDAVRSGQQWIAKMTEHRFGMIGYDYPGGAPATYAWVGGGALAEARRGSRAGLEVDRVRFPPETSAAPTAMGVWCNMLVSASARKNKLVKKSLAVCLEYTPEWDTEGGHIDMFSWFFGALSIAHHTRGYSQAGAWFDALHAAVLTTQRPVGSGAKAGSWDPIGTWGHAGGRVYSTAILALALEAPYLYAPNIIERPTVPKEFKAAVSALYARARGDDDENVRTLAKAAIKRIKRDWSE